MADRYWVGGTATWDGTAGSKWSATNGGAGGASVPTTTDDVYFNQNSNSGTNAFTVTVSLARVCRNITIQNLDGAMTLAGSGSLSIYGNLTFPSTGLTITNTGTLTIRGQSSVVNTGGILIRNISLGSRSLTKGAIVTESVTLAGSLNVFGNFFIACNLDTQGFTVQSLKPIYIEDYVFTVNFRTSNIYATAIRGYDQKTFPTNVNFQTSLSNLTITNSHHLSIAIPSTIVLNSLTIYIASSNLFEYVFLWSDIITNDLIIPEPASSRLFVSIAGRLTVNNSISIQSGASTLSTKRVVLSSALEINGVFEKNIGGASLTAVNTDFYGITVAASSVSCTRCGDLGFNTGINFDAPRTLYWAGTNVDVWSNSKWSTMPGQSGAELYPLAQDDVIIDDTSTASILVVDSCWAVKNLNASSRTLPLILSDNNRGESLSELLGAFQLQHFEQFLRITGNLSLSSSISFNGTSPFVFLNSGVHTVDAEYLPGLGVDTHSGTVRLVNNLDVGIDITFSPEDLWFSGPIPRLDSVVSIASGTLDVNTYRLRATKVVSRLVLLPCVDHTRSYYPSLILNAPQVKIFKFSNSTVELGKIAVGITDLMSILDTGGADVYDGRIFHPTHFDIECLDGLLIDRSTTSGAVFITASQQISGTLPIVKNNPLPHLQLSGSASKYYINCVTLDDISSTRADSYAVDFQGGPTIQNWNLSGSSGKLISISNSSPALTKAGGFVQADYLSISYSTVQPPNTWYAGPNSINAGGNINWIFANPYEPESSGDFFMVIS